ncbi:MAG: 30S ribosomal protein S13 [archaeon]
MVNIENFRHIVRLVNTDLDGNKPVYMAIRKIKGVGFMYANLVCHLSGVDRNAKIGSLDVANVDKVKHVLENPDQYKIPVWMKNRRKDYEIGKDKHLLDTNLLVAKDDDIKRLKKIKSYKGSRHTAGLPVRGQNTKSKHRRNKGKALGVTKKK